MQNKTTLLYCFFIILIISSVDITGKIRYDYMAYIHMLYSKNIL